MVVGHWPWHRVRRARRERRCERPPFFSSFSPRVCLRQTREPRTTHPVIKSLIQSDSLCIEVSRTRARTSAVSWVDPTHLRFRSTNLHARFDR